MFKKAKIGFTLIELLVMTAILEAILVPVFQKVREKARHPRCRSNMKHLALGTTQYTKAADERFP